VPRYFFNVLDHPSGPDSEGSELAGPQAAREAAVRLCGEMIRELDGTFWQSPLWQLEVTDEARTPLFTLTFAAQEHGSG
jgi:hypothetical protein